MTVGLIDTSVMIANESGRPLDLDLLPDELRVSVVTVGELRMGVLTAADAPTRAARLRTYLRAVEYQPVPIDEDVAAKWSELRVALRDAGRSMPLNDSWIAATAMHLGLPIVTQDSDFIEGLGFDVIRI